MPARMQKAKPSIVAEKLANEHKMVVVLYALVPCQPRKGMFCWKRLDVAGVRRASVTTSVKHAY